MDQEHSKRIRKQRKKQPKHLRPLIYAISSLVFFLLVFLGLKSLGDATSPKAPIIVEGAPSLVVDQKAVDLGTIKLGETVSYKFTLTNVGDRPLKIIEAPYTELIEGC